MRVNRIMKVFIWMIISAMLLSTLIVGIGWIFE